VSLANVDKAIGLKLLGLKPDAQLPRSADSAGEHRGFKSAVTETGQGQVGFTQATRPGPVGNLRFKSSVGGIATTVPIYFFSPRGVRGVEAWPSISYHFMAMHFNPERYIWRADNFRTPVEGSFTTVDGVIGPQLRKFRDHPEPYDLHYEIRLWSKEDFDSSALLQFILEQFPARGELIVIQNDGTHKSWEMDLVGDPLMVDDADPTLSNRQQRAYSWSLTYSIQTHLDNTLVTELKRTIVNPVDLDMELINGAQS